MKRRISLLELMSQQKSYKQGVVLMEKRMKAIGEFADLMGRIRETTNFLAPTPDIKDQ